MSNVIPISAARSFQGRVAKGTSAGGQFTAAERADSTVAGNLVDASLPEPDVMAQRYEALVLESNDATGANYEPNLDVAEIAKTLRSDYKAWVKSGDLPERFKTSVRISRFAGGQAIDVTVSGVNTEPVAPEEPWMPERRVAAADVLALTKIEERMQSFNYDRSNSQVDYFDVNFYGTVSVDGSGSSQWSGRVCPTCVTYYPCGC